MPSVRSIGTNAEDRAAQYLLESGYSILTRRYKGSNGELDLVAMDGEVLVIVEVKYRKGDFLRPEESVDQKKIDRIKIATEHYLWKNNLKNTMVRFDLIMIDSEELRHYKNAFW
jgi:putative endonuclease